jgi:dCMP deaminase
MNQSEKLDLYLGTALRVSKLSKAERLKVGCVFLTTNGVVIPGYNGTYPGDSNVCEIQDEKGEMKTKPSVLHAEENCIIKAAREGISLKGAEVYVTHNPCLHCCSLLISIGVKSIVYIQDYRDVDSVKLMKEAGIKVHKSSVVS